MRTGVLSLCRTSCKCDCLGVKGGHAPEQHGVASLGSGQAQRPGMPPALGVHKCWKLGVMLVKRL